MQQLPLEVGPPDHAVFDSYFPGPNAALLHALGEIATVRSRAVLWMWGPPGTGRSHLLQATVNAAAAGAQRVAYLPLGPESDLGPPALQGMGELDLVCIDDADRAAGQTEWERGLFRLFEALRQRSARLVLAAGRAPLHTGFVLPDLASRLSSGATFRIRRLSDEELVQALQRRSRWRGLELPNETATYLMRRVQRDSATLFALLDRLDREAMAAQKRLTVPFVKGVLEAL